MSNPVGQRDDSGASDEVRTSESASARRPAGAVASLLRHPLFIAAATLVATVVFVDRIAQVSGDRQRELDLKQRLLTQVADSSTRGVTNAREAAEDAMRATRRKALYNRQAGQWGVEWSRVNSQLQVYFKDERIGSEWKAFADRFDDYLRVAVLRPESRLAEAKGLREELTDSAFLSDPEQRDLASKIDWSCIERPTQTCFFLDDLALVGQLLLVHRTELDRRILGQPAAGFARRVFPPW
jgi:hypothetical protein